MHVPTSLFVSVLMVTVALAGCMDDEFNMLVTPASDPMTEPFRFEAIGPAYDHYEWDFNDGTPSQRAEWSSTSSGSRTERSRSA